MGRVRVRCWHTHDAYKSPSPSQNTSTRLCLCVSKTDSVQSHRFEMIQKAHLISTYKSSVALEEGSNLRKPSDRSACFYPIFISPTEKVILSDCNFIRFFFTI